MDPLSCSLWSTSSWGGVTQIGLPMPFGTMSDPNIQPRLLEDKLNSHCNKVYGWDGHTKMSAHLKIVFPAKAIFYHVLLNPSLKQQFQMYSFVLLCIKVLSVSACSEGHEYRKLGNNIFVKLYRWRKVAYKGRRSVVLAMCLFISVIFRSGDCPSLWSLGHVTLLLCDL